MIKNVIAFIATMLIAFPAIALTIPSGSVISSSGEVVPFHETENAQRQMEENGYAILGNNVAIEGIPTTLTIDEALELIRNGLADADLPPELKEVLESLDDEQLADAAEALNSGAVSADELADAIAGGCDPSAASCAALDHIDLGSNE